MGWAKKRQKRFALQPKTLGKCQFQIHFRSFSTQCQSVGALHGTESKAFADIIVTDEQDNNIGSMFSWFDALKITGLCTSIRLFIACKILPKISKVKHNIQNSNFIKSRNKQAPTVELEEMLNMRPEAVPVALMILLDGSCCALKICFNWRIFYK